MDNKRNLAVIPARSGSKGVKDKNIRLLNNKPLMAYTIEAAKKSNIFNVFMFQQIVPSMQRLQSSMVRKFHFYEAVNWHQTQQEHGIRFDLF